jgi:hypothetical protein
MRAVLRAGAVGGITLAVAVAAQRMAKDPGMALLGILIVIVGFSVVGMFAARDSSAADKRAGSRAGVLSGLVAGFFVALAFVAVNFVVALEPEQVDMIRQQFPQTVQAMRSFSPQLAEQSLQQWQAMTPAQQAQMAQFSVGISAACCGIFYPLLGLLLGAMGGAMSVGAPAHKAKK